MVQENSSVTEKMYNRVSLGVAIVLLLAIFAVVKAVDVANDEYSRDVRNWERQLNITADARADAVQAWVNSQFAEMQAIADNLTVQLFMTEHDYKEDKNELSQDDLGQLGFVQNYLTATAQRTGFASQLPAGQVNVNISHEGNAGVVLLDSRNEPVAITNGMPGIEWRDAQGRPSLFMKNAWKAGPAMKDIFMSEGGEPLIAFSAPVFAVQGDENGGAKQVGVVIGVKAVYELYEELQRSAVMEKTTETVLVRDENGVIRYLSPLNSKKVPLSLRLNRAKDGVRKIAAESVFDEPNKFFITQDYESQMVLATGRAISQTPWVMLHKVSRIEALAESDKRRASIIAISMLIIVLLVVVILAAWRHGSSLRYKGLADKFRSQERLLRLVSDNQPDAMYIIDDHYQYCYANLVASSNANIPNDQILGKTMRNVVGPIKADQTAAITERVQNNERVLTHIQRTSDDAGKSKVVQSKYIPLERVPRVLTGETTPGILVVEQDITQAISEKEKRERLLNGLVDTLVSVVDSRDHYSADHSNRVAEFANAVAIEMNLSEQLIETATIAAKLMNLGKIIMPRELLAKKGKFTAADKQLISEARAASANFLTGVEFNGPVEDTLRQVQECWNGSGELGLRGEESLVTARIVAIANEYVAMTSQRSYRGAMSDEDAVSLLMKQIGKRYERKLVVALVSYIDNGKHAEPELSV
jgi:HD-GYP domain-containing protein (c-di-GMP phosphodiesterase class II)